MTRELHRARFAAAAVLVAPLLTGCAPSLVWRMPSPDHRFHVEMRPQGVRTCVRVGGRLDGCFEGVATHGLVFSRDSRHVAYPAKTGRRWRVMRDGQAGGEWDGIASLAFSPDGGHLVYAALDGRSWRLVLDERAGERWDSLYAGSIIIAPDARHVAYAGLGEGRARAVLDGRAGPAYDRVEALHFSPDGTRFAYVARRGDRASIVVDGIEQPFHDSISELVFSADGRHVAYAFRDSGEFFVAADGTTNGPYASAHSLAYIGITDTLTCVVRIADGEAVLMGHVAGPHYASVDPPASSRRGRRWGYVARRGDSCVVVLDGAIHRAEEHAGDLVFSDDGTRHAYIALREGQACVVDERGAHPFDLLIDGSLVFGRHGNAWACLAGDPRRRRLFVAVEGLRARRAFDWTEIARITRSRELDAPPARADEAVREWIAAEAERIRERERVGRSKMP